MNCASFPLHRKETGMVIVAIEHVEVYAGLSDGGGLMNGRGQQAWQQNQQQRSSGRRINLDAVEESADAIAPVNNSESTDGVDYKI